MKGLFKSIWFISVLALTGCFEKDVFPDTPRIAFEDIVFYDVEGTDSLILTFSFEDGAGDIGLDQNFDLNPPYHIANVVLDRDSILVTDTSEYNPPYYSTPIVLQPFIIQLRNGPNNSPNAPDPYLYREVEIFEYRASPNYELLGNSDPRVGSSDCEDYLDFTFYFPESTSDPAFQNLGSITYRGLVRPNINYYNLIIDFYEQLPNGDERIVDFVEGNSCIESFNGRIPFFDPQGTQGIINYSMQSSILRIPLSINPIRIEFYVVDRKLQRSNVVSTDYFFLEDVTITQ